MGNKLIVFSEEARRKVFSGIEILAKSVKTTLGPKGRNVVIGKKFGNHLITKDGVTVAKEINLKDPLENLGAQMIKEVASKTSDKAGDGTTTATVLAEAIFKEGLKKLSSGHNPIFLQRGIKKAVDLSIKTLLRDSKKVQGSSQIKQIATVSSNWDCTTGDIISKALEKVGKDGTVTVEESNTTRTYLNVVEGMRFDSGYISPYFITDSDSAEITLKDCYILVTGKKIGSLSEILPLLQTVSKSNKPLLIIAEDLEGEALSALILNKLRGTLNVCAVKAPGFGDRRQDILEDISILTGAKCVTDGLGLNLNSLNLSDLGKAKIVVIDKENTTIVEGYGQSLKIKSRALQLKKFISNSTSEYDKSKLKERLSKLSGGVAVIYVGASTETEMKEKKARVEDSLHATKAALEEGVSSGGGIGLLKTLSSLNTDVCLNSDELAGFEIIKKALSAPLKQLCTNAGVEGSLVVQKVLEDKRDGFGYNVSTGSFENLIDSGVIDPTKVTRTALENAASIASLLLTVECVIVEPVN